MSSALSIRNLSDGQIDWLLDDLMRRAIAPLAKASNFLIQLVSDIFKQSFQDKRRKVSPVDRKKCYMLLFEVLHSDDPDVHLENFMEAKIERNLTHEALVKIVKYESEYRNRQARRAITGEADARVEAIERIFGVMDGDSFSLALAEASFWTTAYENFRNAIVMSFDKLAHATTNKIVRGTTLAIDRDDMYKNMMMGAQRAVDKFTSLKGTLASYVRLWFRNAETNPPFPHEYGTSFTVSAGERRRISTKINAGQSAISNLSVTLDEAVDIASLAPSPEKLLSDTRSSIFISHACAGTPNAQFAFLMGDIPYSLDQNQMFRLVNTVYEARLMKELEDAKRRTKTTPS